MEVYVDRHKQEIVYNDSLSRMCQRNNRLHTDMKSQYGFVSNDDLLLSGICLYLSLPSLTVQNFR
jgi:predicted ferric reductase